MKKITENELKNKVSRLREYLAVIEAATPGMGQKGPTVAAAQGADPSNPLNQAPYNAAKDSQAANVPAAQSTKPATAWPTDKNAIIAFQKANGLTPDGMIGAKTMGALQAAGAQPPAGFKPVGSKPAQSTKPAPAPQTQTQQNFAAAGMAGQEMRTPAEIAASADLLSANDGTGQNGGAEQARNPNAGLTPDDPRWQGPKPGMTAADQEDADMGAAMQANQAAAIGANQDAEDQAMGQAMTANAQAANAPAAQSTKPAAAPAKAADGGPPPTPEQLKWLGGADQTDKFILARMRKAVPNAPAPTAAAPAGAVVQGGMAAESVGFDEIQRLVSLVQYR